MTRIRSGENLDEPAFGEGSLTFRQLRRIDQQRNPHLYTEASLLEDADYQPPRYQEDPSEVEEEEEGETQVEEEQVEEQPLPIPEPQGILLRIPRSEHNSPGSSEERLSGVLDEHLGTHNVPTARITRIRLDPGVATRDQEPRVDRVIPEHRIARTGNPVENEGAPQLGHSDTRTLILNLLIIFVIVNFVLNILILRHILNIRFL